jgi:hypothetical protein
MHEFRNGERQRGRRQNGGDNPFDNRRLHRRHVRLEVRDVGSCIPIRLPRLDRMLWHKLHSSIDGNRMADKREKDLIQAVTLATLLVEQDSASLQQSFVAAPAALRAAALTRLPRVKSLLEAHPQTLEAFDSVIPQ